MSLLVALILTITFIIICQSIYLKVREYYGACIQRVESFASMIASLMVPQLRMSLTSQFLGNKIFCQVIIFCQTDISSKEKIGEHCFREHCFTEYCILKCDDIIFSHFLNNYNSENSSKDREKFMKCLSLEDSIQEDKYIDFVIFEDVKILRNWKKNWTPLLQSP